MAYCARNAVYTYSLRHLGYFLNILLNPFKKGLPSEWKQIDGYDRTLTITVNPVEHIGSYIFFTGYYETLEVWALKKLIKPDSVILDVGAHIGTWSLLFAKMAPAGRVYAFEPSGMFERLKYNVEINPQLSTIHLLNLALGAVPGEVALAEKPGPLMEKRLNYGNIQLDLQSTGQGKENRVRVVALDAWVVSENIRKLDWIKMDVEGMEFLALEGGLKSLEEFQPNLMIEINEQALGRYNSSLLQLQEMLKRLGYRCFYRVGKRGRLIKSPWFSVPNGAAYNLICSTGDLA